jgi:hypothetical protein
LVSVLVVPEFLEQARNKNAAVAKRSGRVVASRFFIGDSSLESLILIESLILCLLPRRQIDVLR